MANYSKRQCSTRFFHKRNWWKSPLQENYTTSTDEVDLNIMVLFRFTFTYTQRRL